jgi:hypothetical protein
MQGKYKRGKKEVKSSQYKVSRLFNFRLGFEKKKKSNAFHFENLLGYFLQFCFRVEVLQHGYLTLDG